MTLPAILTRLAELHEKADTPWGTLHLAEFNKEHTPLWMAMLELAEKGGAILPERMESEIGSAISPRDMQEKIDRLKAKADRWVAFRDALAAVDRLAASQEPPNE